jgi:surface antigen
MMYLISGSRSALAGMDIVGPLIGIVSSSRLTKPTSPSSAPAAHPLVAATQPTFAASQGTYVSYVAAPAAGAGPGAWTPVPGHPSYWLGDFAGDPYSGAYGVCTWYAWYRHRNEPLMRLGNAWAWANNAPSYGLSVGSTPVAGATVVLQPGVQGASGAGHVGHVEWLVGNGWFVISEMNFYWNGGGYGRVDYRYAHVGPGVLFIY